MTNNNYNKLIDAICELVNLAWDSTSKKEFERLDNAGADIIDCLEKLQQFEAIGTVEEFNALKEKNVEKKPIMATNMMLKNRDFICPNCEIKMPLKFKYCNHCGQKLDWQ